MNRGFFNEKYFWSGCVNLLDGIVEEVHTYEEASYCDFHHSLYFSEKSIEGMNNGEMAFFFIDDNGKIQGYWRNEIQEDIINKIKKQIAIF